MHAAKKKGQIEWSANANCDVNGRQRYKYAYWLWPIGRNIKRGTVAIVFVMHSVRISNTV